MSGRKSHQVRHLDAMTSKWIVISDSIDDSWKIRSENKALNAGGSNLNVMGRGIKFTTMK